MLLERANYSEREQIRFNGHPPLGVNATGDSMHKEIIEFAFQWAPTLGGECYYAALARGKIK